MAISSFMRREKKYLLTTEQYDNLRAIIEENMELDRFCQGNNWYFIRNIYYDTHDNHLIRMSTLKPNFKEKFRVRKYGSFNEERDEYFLEIKRKINGIVGKRRVSLTKSEYLDFMEKDIMPRKERILDVQILKEIAYFKSIYSINPALYLSYERLAYFDRVDKNFRVTFDKNIITRRAEINLDLDVGGKSLLPNGTFLMEVKITGAVPIWFANALSSLKIYPTSFSKYGTEYQKSIKQEELIYA